MAWIAGVDGFKSRWCAVLQETETTDLRVRVAPTFADLLNLAEHPAIVAVDIPIGLPEFAAPGGRRCEQAARSVLKARAPSVFSAVGRVPLQQASRAEADEVSRASGGLGVGAQAWGLAAKLREADAAMTPEAQGVIREVHPEVSFWRMNNRLPMTHGKKTVAGMRDRQAALIDAGFPQSFVENAAREHRVGEDDLLDALAALWTARRILNGTAERFPAEFDLDLRGLDQAIWF